MIKEDNEDDLNQTPSAQKRLDPPIVTAGKGQGDDDDEILSKIKSQTVLESAQSIDKYLNSL